ncbi:hypothetical protein INT47_011903 [Mucor saturninus]|uniref:Coth-domain-containing protein n=1 Tax=Mucor saturninus TaxID=64648 RepID=A0A8H7UZR5_9FUNG|nr:hypothetical protein INT47_011903 [Mucor saturninus]
MLTLSAAIRILPAVFVTSVIASSNITYNVISLVPNNTTVGVIIDSQVYPLSTVSDDSALLHIGQAPAADTYKYALLFKENTTIIETESFARNGTNEDTLNEYYGRSWNSWALDKIPTILPPLPIIDRIESKLHIDGEIPTIHLTGNQTAIDYMHANQESKDIDIYLNMTYISPNAVKSYQNISVAISGHSTRSYAKLSYKLKLQKDDDLYHYRQLKLRSMATDSSYMREELAYDIAESIGIPSSRYSYARLYMNDQPLGLFGFSENLKNPWIKNEFAAGSKKYVRGTLFVTDVSGGQSTGGGQVMGNQITDTMDHQATGAMGNQTNGGSPPQNQTDGGMGGNGGGGGDSVSSASTSDLSYLGDNVTLYSAGQYSLKEDPSTGTANYTRIMDLTKFISEQSNTTSDDSAISLWQEKMDTDSFLRGLALEIVISNSDAYFTMANNYILYDDLENERLLFSGQDFDLSMGHTMYNVTLMNGANYTEYPGFSTRPLMTRMLQVPQFKQDFENLLVNITKELVNLEILETRIDQIAAMITEDVAWDKSCARVGSSSSSGGGVSSADSNTTSTDIDFVSAVNGPTNVSNNLGIKEWLSLRSTNLLSYFNQTM